MMTECSFLGELFRNVGQALVQHHTDPQQASPRGPSTPTCSVDLKSVFFSTGRPVGEPLQQ